MFTPPFCISQYFVQCEYIHYVFGCCCSFFVILPQCRRRCRRREFSYCLQSGFEINMFVYMCSHRLFVVGSFFSLILFLGPFPQIFHTIFNICKTNRKWKKFTCTDQLDIKVSLGKEKRQQQQQQPQQSTKCTLKFLVEHFAVRIVHRIGGGVFPFLFSKVVFNVTHSDSQWKFIWNTSIYTKYIYISFAIFKQCFYIARKLNWHFSACCSFCANGTYYNHMLIIVLHRRKHTKPFASILIVNLMKISVPMGHVYGKSFANTFCKVHSGKPPI